MNVVVRPAGFLSFPMSRPASREHQPVAPEQSESVQLSGQGSEDSVEAGFREAFFEDYEARHCGQNIRRFVTRFPEALKDAKVLGIENRGFSYFGLVRALHARDTNRWDEMMVTDKNWYHHVILEHDGRIYDFDYGITPEAPTVEEYFDTMFLTCDKVPAQEKLKSYSLQVIDAGEYADATQDTSTRCSLGEYLEGWGVNLERYAVGTSTSPASPTT